MSDRNLRLECALRYISQGWPVLVLHNLTDQGTCSCGKPNDAPNHKPGKHPRTPHGVKDATTDERRMRAWLSKWPEANIGIRTGQESGLVAYRECSR